MKDIKLVYLLVIFFPTLICAQDFLQTEIQNFDGKLLNYEDDCLEVYNDQNDRNLKRGRNQRGNNWFFIGVGQSRIVVSIDNPNYVNAVQNAFALASLEAKRELAEFLGKDIEDSIIVNTIEAIKTGRKPIDVAREAEDQELKRLNYDSSEVLKKAFMLAHRKLDEVISKNFEIDQAEDEIRSRLGRVLAQSTLKRITTATAYSEIRGMKNLYIRISKTNVCVVSVFSSKTRVWADAIAKQEYKSFKYLEKDKLSMKDVIPDKRDNNGLRKLLGSFGIIVDVDPNGQIYIVSFAQAGALSTSPNELVTARKIAQIQAEAQIAQFKKEAVEVYTQLENIEVVTTNINETKDYYSERNFLDRLNASSKTAIKGIVLNSWWTTIHPYTEKPVVGVVVTWTPSDAGFLKK